MAQPVTLERQQWQAFVSRFVINPRITHNARIDSSLGRRLGNCPTTHDPIAVDKQATPAVHDGVSSAPDFCAEIAMPIAMPNHRNSHRTQAQP
jgi:hypothetical protein